MKRALTLAALLVLAAGCTPGPSDERGLVHDLRVLALRLDPPEVEVSMTGDGPAADVALTALVAAPGADAVTLTVRGCESPGPDACEGRAVDDPDRAALLAPLTETTTEDAPVPTAPPSVHGSFARTLPQDLLLDLLGNAGALALAGARPAFEVRAEASDGAETAFKRLQVSYPDAAYRLALAQAGIEICDGRGLPEGCLEYRTRVPNTNPALTSLSVHREADDPNVFAPYPEDGPLEIRAGEQVTLLPQCTADSKEPYQTLTLDVESRQILVEDREELLVYAWFATAGYFDYDRTEQERTLGVRNVYTAPETVPAGGEDVFAWIVVRDTRGGVDFRALTFHVVP